MQTDLIKQKIIAALGESDVIVTSVDGMHFEATVTSAAFAGLSRLEQHRMVLKALEDVISSNEVHALSLKTKVSD